MLYQIEHLWRVMSYLESRPVDILRNLMKSDLGSQAQGVANLLWFARHGGRTQPALGRHHPDQGEDNSNRKGVAGNGKV